MSIDWGTSENGGVLAVTKSSSGILVYNQAYIHDGSIGTQTYFRPSTPMSDETLTYTITLDETIFLDFLAILHYYRVNTGAGHEMSLETEAFYGGTWHSIYTDTIDTTDAGVYTSVNLSGISKVRVTISGITRTGTGGMGDPITYSTGYIGVLGAWGSYYQDKGLRFYDGATTKKIGVETLEDSYHKLRVRINGTTYGIPLVSTSHALATALRVRVGGTTYALVDVT